MPSPLSIIAKCSLDLKTIRSYIQPVFPMWSNLLFHVLYFLNKRVKGKKMEYGSRHDHPILLFFMPRVISVVNIH